MNYKNQKNSIGRIVSSMKIFFANQFNFEILFISLGLSLMTAGRIVLASSGKSEKFLYLFANNDFLKSFVKLIAKATMSDRFVGIILIIAGFIFLIFLACFFATKNKISSYTIWSLVTIFMLIPYLFIARPLNLAILILVITWLIFGIIWSIKELYNWLVKEPKTMLAKLTFLWGIIAVLLGFMFKG